MRCARLLSLITFCAFQAPILAGPTLVDCNENGIDDSLDLVPLVAAVGQDACERAQHVGPGFVYTGTTVGATNDGSAGCASSATSPDVWYRYLPSAPGVATVDLCGSSYDTALSVHVGCPGTVSNQIACNDDSNCSSSGLHSTVQFEVVDGVEYLIRVSGFSGNSGNFVMNLAGPPSVVGGSLDLNGNSIPDECETDFRIEPNRLFFSAFSDDMPTTAGIAVSSRTGSTIDFTASTEDWWLDVQPTGGSIDGNPQELVVTVNPALTGVGSFQGTITLADTASPDAASVQVNLSVRERPPIPSITPGTINLRIREGENAPPGEITVTNTGGRLDYQFFYNVDWIRAVPATGTLGRDESTTHSLVYTMSELPEGAYSGLFAAGNPNANIFAIGTVNLVVDPPDCNGNEIDDAIDILDGVSADCNDNGIPDECDIAAGNSIDANGNGVPDECEPANCAPLPFFDGFEEGAIGTYWVASGTADSRIRVEMENGDYRALLDDRANEPVILFQSDFESPDSEDSFVVQGGSLSGTDDFTANFQYDYSTYDGPSRDSTNTRPEFIPLAPRSSAGGSRALRLEVNQRDTFPENAAVTVFPAAEQVQNLENFTLIFDAFANFNGTGEATGASPTGVGTTEHLGAGLAGDNLTAMWPNNGTERLTGWLWAMTIDGGSTTDYDYWEASANDSSGGLPLRFREAPTWFGNGLANVNGNSTAWRNLFSFPAYEQAGSAAKEWVTVEMEKRGGVVTLYFTPAAGNLAGVRSQVAQWQPNVTSGANLAGFPNVGVPFVSFFDTFSSIAQFPEDQFVLIDNLAIITEAGNAIPSRTALSLCVDLTGEASVRLGFDARVAGNDLVVPSANPFRNNDNFDGVAISDDQGRTWYEVQGLRTETGEDMVRYGVNLDDHVTSWGLSYNSGFQIRFNEFGNESFPNGGLQIDNIRIDSNRTARPRVDIVESELDVEWLRGTPLPTPTFRVRNSGGGTLTYSILADGGLFRLGSTSGTSIGETDTIPMDMLLEGRPAGSFTSVIFVTDPMSSNVTDILLVRTTIRDGQKELMGIY